MAILHTFYWCLQVVIPSTEQKGFIVQQTHWVVEYTFAILLILKMGKNCKPKIENLNYKNWVHNKG
jgi:hypothetical protein